MTDSTRRWVMIGTLAAAGAVGGGVAGYSVAPDVVGVVASLAVAGFGLGGALGTLFAGGGRPAKQAQPAVKKPGAEAGAEPGAQTRAGAQPRPGAGARAAGARRRRA